MRIVVCSVTLLVLAWVAPSWGKVFERCDLVKRLLSFGIPKADVADWVCLAKAESGYNTRTRTYESNGSVSFGLFQINNRNWCSNRNPDSKECKMTCDSLIDASIQDDVICAARIYRLHRFNAWNGWKRKCKNKDLSAYVKGCGI